MKLFAPNRTISRHGSLNRQMGTGALVVLLHVGIIYAIVTGLMFSHSLELPNILEAKVFLDESKPTPPPTAAPETLQMARPQLPVVSAPVIKMAPPLEPHRSITVLPGSHATGSEVHMTAPIHTSPAPTLSKLPTLPATALVDTHSTPPYPELSRRLGEQGSVILTISVDASGKVADVSVRNSSGYQRLDDAAVSWIQSHWLYRPATHGGTAVKSVVTAKIVFDLHNE